MKVILYMAKYWKKSFEDYGKLFVKKLSGISVVAHMPCESVQIEPSNYNRDMIFLKSKNYFVVFELQRSRLTHIVSLNDFGGDEILDILSKK